MVDCVGRTPFGPFGGMVAECVFPLAGECGVSAVPLPLVSTGSAITGEILAGDLIGVVFDSSVPSIPPKLSPLLRAFLRSGCVPCWLIGSTKMKLVLTVDRGLDVSEAGGERPREGGEVLSGFASNMARRLRTPLLDRLSDMTAR